MDIPGIAAVHYSASAQENLDSSIVCFPLTISGSNYGEFRLQISSPLAFTPYEAYLKNFSFMVAVILEERRQRRLNELHQIDLEQHIQERTQQLRAEIAERQRIEDALRKSEERYRILFEQSPDGIVILDPETSQLLTFNDQVCRQLGYTREEIGHLSLAEIEVVETLEESLNHIQKIIRAGRDDFETRHRTKLGEIRNVYVTAQIIGTEEDPVYHCIWRDITEQKQADEVLRHERDRAQNYLDTVEAIIVALDMEGRITLINRQGCQLLGYVEKELVGKVWFETCLPQPEGTKAVYPVFLQLMAGAGGVMEYYENSILTREGDLRYVAWHNTILKDEMGQSIGTLSAGEDITERKRTEEQIKRALAEKETLLRELYHRTKNNMNVIIALLEMQADYFEDEHLQAAFVETGNRIRSMALVHQKLYEANDLSQINLKDYISNLVALLVTSYSITSEQISVIEEMVDVFVLIDTAIPCGLILNELISNALKYAFPDGRSGKITLILRRTEMGEIHLCLMDDGIGLPPGFDPRQDGKMGLQNVFLLGEDQLQARVSFRAERGVICELDFKDNLYQPRV